MKHNRLVGLLLIAVSAISLWQCSDEKIFSMFVILLACIGAFSNINIKMRTSRKVISLLVLALLFAVYYRATHSGGSFFTREAVQTQWLTLSKYFIMASVFYLFVNRRGKMPPAIVLFLSISVLISPQIVGGNMTVPAIIYTFCFVIAAVFFCASSLNYNIANYSGIKSKVTIFSVIIAFSLAVGWYGGNTLNLHGESFIDYLMRYHPAPHLFSRGTSSKSREKVEFGDISRLDSVMRVKASKSKKIILRVFADNIPNYIRSMVYSIWDGDSWLYNQEEFKLGHPVTVPATVRWQIEPRDKDNVFELEPLLDSTVDFYSKYKVLDIWPVADYSGTFFLPYDLRYVRMASEQVLYNHDKIMEYAGDYYQGANYQVAIPVSPMPLVLPDEMKPIYLQLPEGKVHWQVLALAEKITAGCNTSAAKISAVKNYFHNNYKYDLDVKIPDRQDPITYFLLNQPDAYCEYFAAGTAVLLRIAGVPCRYVTGVVVSERDTITDCWVARQRDAHAWVEAWDDKKNQWVIVESTPAGGVPEAGQEVSLASNYIDYLKFKFQEFRLSLGLGGINGLRMWVSEALYNILKWLFTTIPGMLVLLIILLLMSERAKAKLVEFWQRRNIDPNIRKMNRKLAGMDRRLSRFGLRRLPEETVRAFANRIRESDHPKLQNKKEQYILWYLEYENLRYTLNLNRL